MVRKWYCQETLRNGKCVECMKFYIGILKFICEGHLNFIYLNNYSMNLYKKCYYYFTRNAIIKHNFFRFCSYVSRSSFSRHKKAKSRIKVYS